MQKAPTAIIGRSNGVGLDRDARIVEHALAYAEQTSEFRHCRRRNPLARYFAKPSYNNIIHLERLHGRFFGAGRSEFLIPNQERFPDRQLPQLARLKAILCKTQHAAEIFSALGLPVRYIGFTSTDLLVHNAQPDYNRFFHLAGRSTEKNTEAILRVWSRHADWPTLTLVQHPDNAPASVPDNVNLISEYLSDENLKLLQNQNGIHLCPSRCEGWGHYIVEAMSVRACVVSTDAPPMNELVSPEHGVLVATASESPRRLGKAYEIDEAALEQTIENLIAMPTQQKAELGNAARLWFEQNHTTFLKRFAEVIDELMQPTASLEVL